VIVMPVTTPRDQGRRGAPALVREVRAARRQLLRTPTQHARQLEAQQGLTFVHPFDDPDVIAGQGTIGMEILRQHHGPDRRRLRAPSAAAD
jgi:threonine dehydratase